MIKFILQSTKYYYKHNFLLFLLTAISAAIITGALITGDSVKHSLKKVLHSKIGKIEFALITNNNFFDADIASKLAKYYPGINSTSLLKIKAVVNKQNDVHYANNVELNGVNNSFFNFFSERQKFQLNKNNVLINKTLADKLKLKKDDHIVVKIQLPSKLPADTPFSKSKDLKIFKLKIQTILNNNSCSNFSLFTNHIPSPQIFMSNVHLNKILNLKNKANIILNYHTKTSLNKKALNIAIQKSFTLKDYGLYFKKIPSINKTELRTKQIFIAHNISKISQNILSSSQQIFSYFVNSIENTSTKKATPYSIISSSPSNYQTILKDNEIAITRWLADDLRVKKGDSVSLYYYVIGLNKELLEKKHPFIIKDIIPVSKTDQYLMPDFPGLENTKNCQDWQPGIPINLEKIRPIDEQYWEKYKGTPKAFVSLKTAQKLWGNNFGNLTAIRFNDNDEDMFKSKLEKMLRPSMFGFNLYQVKRDFIDASENSVSFSQLFLGLSFFIIIAVLILTSLFYIISIENRTSETGTFKALGFTHKTVKYIFLLQGGLISFLGSFTGLFIGMLYNKIILKAIATIWIDIVQFNFLHMKINFSSLLLAFFSSFVINIVTIYFVLKKNLQQNIYALQRKTLLLNQKVKNQLKWFQFIIVFIFLVIVFFLVFAIRLNFQLNFFTFFFMGFLTQIECLLTIYYFFICNNLKTRNKPTLFNLAVNNLTKQSKQNLSVIAILVISIFITLSISSNKKNAYLDYYSTKSGTGGFSLLAKLTIPLTKKIFLSNNAQVFHARSIQAGDASCLNLAQSSQPSIIGLNPELFAKKKAFTFDLLSKDTLHPWLLLDKKYDENIVPAIADSNVIKWAIGKKLGDHISYTNEYGKTIKLKFVAGLSGSIFQGYIIISEQNFVKHFPSVSGYNFLLLKTKNPASRNDAIAQKLDQYGLQLFDTRQYLASFNSVENTYLSIFLILGGIGLILGTFALGIVLIKNIIARRQELALLQALGFTKTDVFKIIFYEYTVLLFLGLFSGLVSSFIVIFPKIILPGNIFPLKHVIVIVILISSSGLLSITAAALIATKKNLIDSLRNE